VKFHVKLDIEGALKNRSFGGFVNTDGSKAHWKQVKKFLEDELESGKKYLPFGDCESFNYQTGCPGHEETKEES
jgi:hypothetical protein